VNDLAFAGHVDEVDLVCRMDGALAEAEATSVEAHLARCPRCAERLRLLGDWSRNLSQVLEATDTVVALPAKPVLRVARRQAWKIAASIVLVVSLGAVVSPVRAWLLHGVRSAWLAITRPTPAAPVAPVSSTVTVRPGGPSFTINVPGLGTESRLTIEVAAGDSVSVVALRTSGARILVLPDGLQLGTGGDFRLRIPARLDRVTIARDHQVLRTLRPATVGEHWEFVFQRGTNEK
jgi:anti-sigma factor RsiW